jgi:hypothetical protein
VLTSPHTVYISYYEILSHIDYLRRRSGVKTWFVPRLPHDALR